MNPLQSDTGADSVWMQRVYGVLIFIEADGTLVPQLAESWDLASDFSSLTCKLRQGIKFHNGPEFTAQAVKSHIERMTDPAFKVELAKRLAPIGAMEVVDNYTLKLTLTDEERPHRPNLRHPVGDGAVAHGDCQYLPGGVQPESGGRGPLQLC